MTMPDEIHPGRAKAKSPGKLWGDPSWVAEEKLDGYRYLAHFSGGLGRLYLTGRRVSSETGSLSEKGAAVQCLTPACPPSGRCVLDGEVMPPDGRGFRDVAAIMNSLPENAVAAMQRMGRPRYVVFDVLFWDGEDVRERSWIERRALLSGLDFGNELVSLVDARNSAPRSFYDDVVGRGGEGVVLKNIFSPYGEDWVKVKKESTLDVVVVGFKPGLGKYDGQVGAARVAVLDDDGRWREVGLVSGMTDEVRMDMTTDPQRWLGSVVEIAAQEMGRDRLRHPRFRRARSDADARQATLRKMLEDLGAEREEVQLPDEGQLDLFA